MNRNVVTINDVVFGKLKAFASCETVRRGYKVTYNQVLTEFLDSAMAGFDDDDLDLETVKFKEAERLIIAQMEINKNG